MIGSLFSGIGGLELGLERAGVGRTAWQCEQDTAAQAVLRRHWPGLPIYDDVRRIGAANVGPVDVLCGGFPCQDISLAGSGAGLEGARSGLWFEYLRLVRELRPRHVVAENVAALVTRGLDTVLGGLAESGHDALWFTLRASDVGAPHRRERLFIIAWRLDVGPGRVSDADGGAVRELAERSDVGRGGETAEVGHAESVGRREGRTECTGRERLAALVEHGGQHEWPPGPGDTEAWAAYLERHPGRAPAVGGKLNPGFVEALMGFPDGWTDGARRNQRLKMLGNAVVPQCGEVVGHVIGGLT